MPERFIQKHQVFFENLSRKIIAQINYADIIDESLESTSVSHLLTEEIEKSELENLQKMAEEAKTEIDDTIAIASELGFKNTAEYLEGLKSELPGTFSMVKMAFSGDSKGAAEEIGKVTTATTKLNLARDSFYDAVVLFGSELEKLPFSSESVWKAFEEKNTDEQGQLTIPGLEDQKLGEFQTQIKSAKLVDIIKAATDYEGLEGLEFPDEDLIRQAAENSYKEPPEPKGFWGKVGKFFGMSDDLTSEQFADDVLEAPLDKLIEKAKEIAAERAAAQKDADETTAIMQDLGTDVQALGQGDASVVSGAPTSQTADQQTTVNMPGAGNVPLTPQTITQVAPGFDQAPGKAADKKMVPIPELEKTVTQPEEVGEGEWLASLINDDPKSAVVFFDPEAAEKAAKEAEKSKEDKKPESGDDKSDKQEGWVHSKNMSDWLFESRMPKQKKSSSWIHKTPLKKALFSEAIFYKDVAKALKAQGVEDADLPIKAAELAKRLENQYDVQIADLPEVEAEEAAVAAAEQIQQAGLTAQDLKDILKQQGEMNNQTMELMKDILASKDESEVQRAIARANEEGVQVTNILTATAEASSESATGSGKKEEKKPGKKRDRTGPPSDKMVGRGKEVGLDPKEGETGEQFGARVRKEEEKQGKRKKKPSKKSGSGSKASATASASSSSTSEAHWHRGELISEEIVHVNITLTEALLGPSTPSLEKNLIKNNRWMELAGLEDE